MTRPYPPQPATHSWPVLMTEVTQVTVATGVCAITINNSLRLYKTNDFFRECCLHLRLYSVYTKLITISTQNRMYRALRNTDRSLLTSMVVAGVKRLAASVIISAFFRTIKLKRLKVQSLSLAQGKSIIIPRPPINNRKRSRSQGQKVENGDQVAGMSYRYAFYWVPNSSSINCTLWVVTWSAGVCVCVCVSSCYPLVTFGV